MNVYDANAASLAARYPDFTRQILSRYAPTEELEISASDRGQPTARLRGRLLHSRRDPTGEAQRFAELRAVAASSCCLFFGFGLGYYVETVLARYPGISAVVIEPDVPLFLAALRARDVRGILDRDDVSLVLDAAPDAVAAVLERHARSSIHIVAPRALVADREAYFRDVEAAVSSFVARQNVNRNTLRRFGRLWVRNFVRNMRLLPGVGRVADAAGAFSGIPAVLLAAGPTLDAVIPLLPRLRERAVIISVDTSYRAALSVGVVPDFLVVVDPQYWNTRHLDHCPTEQTVLISESSTHPTILRRRYRARLFCDSLFPLGRYVEEAIGGFGKLGAGGSVATTAWDFARLVDCRPLFCSGLDLGYPGLRTHFRGSVFEEWFHALSDRHSPAAQRSFRLAYDANPFRVPSAEGGEVMTDRRLIIYKWWFEGRLRTERTVDSVNLSRGGVAIEGMRQGSAAEAAALPRRRDEVDDVLSRVAAPPCHDETQSRARMEEARGRLIGELSAAIRLAGDAADRIGAAPGEQPEAERRTTLAALDRIDGMLARGVGSEVVGFLAQDLVADVVERAERPKDIAEALERSRRLYTGIAELADFHLRLLSKAQERGAGAAP